MDFAAMLPAGIEESVCFPTHTPCAYNNWTCPLPQWRELWIRAWPSLWVLQNRRIYQRHNGNSWQPLRTGYEGRDCEFCRIRLPATTWSSDSKRRSSVKVLSCLRVASGELNGFYRRQNKEIVVPSEFVHIASVMATAARRPLLVLREKAVAERGVVRGGYLRHVVKTPASLSEEWLDSPEFQSEFAKWMEEVKLSRHVFLGYSFKATEAANALYQFLSEKLKLRVFDWHDFQAGDTIWESIERAERHTNCGLFLFMADDKLAGGRKGEFAPRANVAYEAGYFAGAKGA